MAMSPYFSTTVRHGRATISKTSNRTLDFVAGLLLAIVSIGAGLIIWIQLFDSKGGEPGSTTIFSLIFYWPLLLAYAVAIGGLTREYQWLIKYFGLVVIALVAIVVYMCAF